MPKLVVRSFAISLDGFSAAPNQSQEEPFGNDGLVEELYLRCLAREPNPTEMETCLEYVKSVGNRTEAFEDILWSLVNSTEFLNRK